MATNKEVMASMNRTLKLCAETLQKKSKEYAGSNKDRLLNFKVAAELGLASSQDKRINAPYKVLWGYLLKHVTSIAYMCRMTTNKPSRADWDEKIGDAINYLLLLSAMVDEDIAGEEEERHNSKVHIVQQEKYFGKHRTPAKNVAADRIDAIFKGDEDLE